MTDELDALEKRLREPKEWHTFAGYAITFKDDTPFEAAYAIASLRRKLAEKEARITELQADWRETIRSNAEEVCSLQSQLTAEREAHANMASAIAKLEEAVFAERERADSIAQESAETLVQAEKWEVSCGEQTRRLGTALVERDAAQAEVRELRELLKEARAFFRKYDWPPDLLARIDAKLTDGA